MEIFSAAIVQRVGELPPPDGWFYYALTISLFICVLAVVYGVFKWFVNRLDQAEEKREEYFEKLTEAITELKNTVHELKIISSVHEVEIENIKKEIGKPPNNRKR